MAKAPAPKKRTRSQVAKRPKPGRPAHVPTAETRAQVRWGTVGGVSRKDIAGMLGITDDTLRKYYRDELEFGTTKANINLVARIYKKAMDGDTASLIYLTKVRLGWREVNRTEHTGADGGAIKLETRDLSNLTDEQLDALERAALAFASGTGGTSEPS